MQIQLKGWLCYTFVSAYRSQLYEPIVTVVYF